MAALSAVSLRHSSRPLLMLSNLIAPLRENRHTSPLTVWCQFYTCLGSVVVTPHTPWGCGRGFNTDLCDFLLGGVPFHLHVVPPGNVRAFGLTANGKGPTSGWTVSEETKEVFPSFEGFFPLSSAPLFSLLPQPLAEVVFTHSPLIPLPTQQYTVVLMLWRFSAR